MGVNTMDRQSVEYRWRIQSVKLGLWSVLAVASITQLCSAQDPALALEDSLIKIVEQNEAAVVSVARIKRSPIPRMENLHLRFGGAPRHEIDRNPNELELLPNEYGAGSLISPSNSADRFVLTNLHVVRGGPVYPEFKADNTELHIQFSDRRGCRAAIIAADPRSDLAVLRLDWEEAGIKPTDYPRLNWEEATPPRKGQFCVLLGNPYAIARDGSASVSWGLVSNLTRQPISTPRSAMPDNEEMAQQTMLYRLGAVMQLDARMNLGTSGSPVLNLKGELIGIGTSLAAIEGYDQSVGFALPVDPLTRRIIRTLLAGQEVEYGMIGIRPGEMAPRDFLSLNTGLPQRSAAVVYEVTPGSPAFHAKLTTGDVIVKVEDDVVGSDIDLMRLVGLHPPNSEIKLTVWMTKKALLQKVAVRLTKWPVRDDEGIIETNPRYAPWRGLTIDYATARAKYPDHGESRKVLITRVADDSPGAAARLQTGNFISHVNNVPVQNPAEFYAAVKSATGPVALKMSDPPAPAYMPQQPPRVVIIRE